jgi:carboxymethylenebutenolidase
MGEFTTLMARDGHEFQAWLSAPAGRPRGAVIVAQEIFGVNRHIRAVTDDYAARGYVAIAPAMFDRIRRGIELDYTPAGMQEGIGYMLQSKREHAVADLSAALATVRHAGKVGAVGYCWGGYLAWLTACELPVSCAVSYYGGPITQNLGTGTPGKPMMFHYGERDGHIPLTDVDKVRAAHPNGIFHLYPAGHGFNCNERADYDQPSAELALQRTLDFFTEHLG